MEDITSLFPSDEALDVISNGIYGSTFSDLVGEERVAVFNIALHLKMSLQLERIANNLRPV